MAKVGYIWLAPHYEMVEADKRWMSEYGCVRIVEEQAAHERLRPEWKQLLSSLDRGDELVLGKLSNAVRGARELALLLEICRIKVVRLVSVNDRIDSQGELFPETTVQDVLLTVGALPAEAVAMRRAASHVKRLKMKCKAKSASAISKLERNKMVVNMYRSGHTIDDIWITSGFHSRSSVFRVLNAAGVNLNRGATKGPLGPRKRKDGENEQQ